MANYSDHRTRTETQVEPRFRERYERGDGLGAGGDLKTLLSRLSADATQLAHDELALVKLELRDTAETFSDDIQQASRTLVKDLGKLGIALTLGMLAGLALTTGAILGVGQLLGDAFWAGGLIVGLLLLGAAAAFGMSAGKDMSESDAMRLKGGRRALQRDKEVLRDEAQEMKRFAGEEAEEFKRHASPSRNPDAGGGRGRPTSGRTGEAQP